MMPGTKGPSMGRLEAGGTGLRTFMDLKLPTTARKLENRSVDGRVKKLSSQAVEMARNRVFLQSR